MTGEPWAFVEETADPAELHASFEPGVPTVRWSRPTGSALVLGSTQPDDNLDRSFLAEQNLAIVRRRSGGGAVLVGDDELVWLDVFVPATHPLWHPDVGKAFVWLGDVWVRVLEQLGVFGSRNYDGPLCTTEWSRQVCFAGLGPGEVQLDDAKVVGIAQRRTRAGALFQSMLLRRWDPETLVRSLSLPARAVDELTPVAAPVTAATDEDIVATFRRELARA